MGTVHLARCDGPGGFRKWLAIKICHPGRDPENDILPMFLDEARVAAQISHPNVVSVFDAGEENGLHYMAMEYLHGEPLRALVRHVETCGMPVPIHVACRMIADAAEGLHAAHEATNDHGEPLHIVHRDVSPHNLFVTYDGTTKLVDFGVAKFRAKSTETRAGTIKGKVAYMSPEQVRGEAVDRRADVFALGIILWELTTGRRLFRGGDTLDSIAKVLEADIPPPTSLVRGYPADLEAVVMAALSRNREDRFDTAHDLARALTGVLFRRGLFVTNDDVFLYMQAVFHGRIQERDAVLRTASALSLRREPSSPALPPPRVRPPLPRPLPPPRSVDAARWEMEAAPLPLVHPPVHRQTMTTMDVMPHELEDSVEVILDCDIVESLSPAMPAWTHTVAPPVEQPLRRPSWRPLTMTIFLAILTLLSAALLVFAIVTRFMPENR
jgi:serine/threonine-protein kinase